MIDFGSLRAGEHGEDARPLYHLGRAGVDAFGKALREQGLPYVTFEHARLWLMTNFATGMIDAIGKRDTENIHRITQYLKDYSSERNWDELDQFIQVT